MQRYILVAIILSSSIMHTADALDYHKIEQALSDLTITNNSVTKDILSGHSPEEAFDILVQSNRWILAEKLRRTFRPKNSYKVLLAGQVEFQALWNQRTKELHSVLDRFQPDGLSESKHNIIRMIIEQSMINGMFLISEACEEALIAIISHLKANKRDPRPIRKGKSAISDYDSDEYDSDEDELEWYNSATQELNTYISGGREEPSLFRLPKGHSAEDYAHVEEIVLYGVIDQLLKNHNLTKDVANLRTLIFPKVLLDMPHLCELFEVQQKDAIATLQGLIRLSAHHVLKDLLTTEFFESLQDLYNEVLNLKMSPGKKLAPRPQAS